MAVCVYLLVVRVDDEAVEEPGLPVVATAAVERREAAGELEAVVPPRRRPVGIHVLILLLRSPLQPRWHYRASSACTTAPRVGSTPVAVTSLGSQLNLNWMDVSCMTRQVRESDGSCRPATWQRWCHAGLPRAATKVPPLTSQQNVQGDAHRRATRAATDIHRPLSKSP